MPLIKNIHIQNVIVEGAAQAASIDALPNIPLQNVEAGEKSTGIQLINTNTANAKNLISIGRGVRPDAVKIQ